MNPDDPTLPDLATVMGKQNECQHVYPMFGREHVFNRHLDCWCHPVVDSECWWVIIHNVEH